MFEENEMELWGALDAAASRKLVLSDGDDTLDIKDCEQIHGRPLLGKILVLPRVKAEKFYPDRPWACISIMDSAWFDARKFPPIPDVNRVKILRLGFDDIEFERPEHRTISLDQARGIWAFVKKYWDQIEILMIHCHAGISRSPAVAKALTEVYHPEYLPYYERLYNPNRLVYAKMLEAKVTGL